MIFATSLPFRYIDISWLAFSLQEVKLKISNVPKDRINAFSYMKYYISISKKVNLFVYRFIRVVVPSNWRLKIIKGDKSIILLFGEIVFIVAPSLQRFTYCCKISGFKKYYFENM